MTNTLIGRKIDQTQKFLENGKRIPVTLISVSDNAVLQVKTLEKDAYSAVQLGFGTKKKANKASTGHSKKAGFDKVSAVIKEVRMADGDLPTVGESIAVDAVFKPGDIITVSGTSKGKGFAGVVKRHGFRGGPKTHGQSDRERAPGSIGQTTTPGRVYRGKKMAGRMGSDTVTVANLTVVSVDVVNKILLVSGLVPGHKDTILLITKVGETKKFVGLLEDVKVEEEAAKKEETKETDGTEETKVETETTQVEEPTEKVEEVEASASTEATVDKEVVADATETVVVAEETVGESVEEVKAEATISEPEVVKKASDASTDAEAIDAKEEEKK
jgi:large subunit ribosomal protein L3